MRELSVRKITECVKEMCIEVNYILSPDMEAALHAAAAAETSPVGHSVLVQLEENLRIAAEERIPICQDTGMAVVFLEIGQEVCLVDGDLETAVNEGVRQAYEEGYLRKSVVGDPLIRENTRDNTPAVIHTRIVPGSSVRVRVAPKGFGSENMSRIFMLKPAQGIEGVKAAVLQTVREAGPNACPPIVVGVGIGGTFEKAALMAKEALMDTAGTVSSCGRRPHEDTVPLCAYPPVPWARELEQDLLEAINGLGIGPGGLGGRVTALAVHINTYATHIAGLPVAVNICCHVNRHAERVI